MMQSGIEVERTFLIDDQDAKSIHYFQQISESSDKQVFKSPWGGCVFKNCNETGELLKFSSIGVYEKFKKDNRKQMWLHLPLKVFKLHGSPEMFAVFVCPECVSMSSVGELQVCQDPEIIKSRLCFHSKVASMIIGDWRNHWNINISSSDLLLNVVPNQDSEFFTFIPHSTTSTFLAAVMNKKKLSLLYCATERQEQPFCTSCVRRPCHHNSKLVSYEKDAKPQEDEGQDHLFEEDHDYEPSPNSEEENIEFNQHYMKTPPNHVRGYLYGYNFKQIIYPFSNSNILQKAWMERLSGVIYLPKQLVPLFEAENKCKHNSPYSSNDKSLVRESKNVCLFNELGQRVFESEVYARPSEGPCKCLQRVDGNDLLIWNLGKGRFVDYTLLHSYLHKWRVSGISMYAMYKSIVDGSESCGISCSLTYPDLHRAICGFFCNLAFDVEVAFSCPTHGTSPSWIVADGKALGPLKRRVKHLEELDVAKDDDSVMAQSTHCKDRIFLNSKKERKVVCQLLTGDISMEEFSLTREILTENGILVINLVAFIQENNPLKIPDPYIEFLCNISKNSSVRSLMQVTKLEYLEFLDQYCKEVLDLRITDNEEKMRAMIKTFPALWPILDSICTFEKTKYLPRQVSRIVLQMLKIRFKTFEDAKKRSNTSYYLWQDPSEEHPTQCYPTLPIWRYPSKYQVSKQVDSDLCEKTFTYHSDFCAGIFSIGCGCESNITFGFELMLLKESPRNLFRFLMTRDVDLESLQGILIDCACIFEPYMMNREAKILEKMNVLVDGAHWAGQKKLKKNDRTGKGGHIGCSDGYNFNLYKEHLDEQVNSQGREQLHSLIEKCAQSLRQLSYRHFMIFMRVFFAITNLSNRKYK